MILVVKSCLHNVVTLVFQKLQAAAKKEFVGDNMDLEDSTKAMDFLNKASVSSKIDELLTEGNLSQEDLVLVRRYST